MLTTVSLGDTKGLGFKSICPLALSAVDPSHVSLLLPGVRSSLDSPVYHHMTLLYTPDPKVYPVMSFSFFHDCLHEYIFFQKSCLQHIMSFNPKSVSERSACKAYILHLISTSYEEKKKKRKRKRVCEGTLTSPPASLLRSRRAPEQRPAPLPSFPFLFLCAFLLLPGRRKQIKKSK